MKELALRIRKFLKAYASISPNYLEGSDSEYYTGPDPYQLEYAAEMLEKGEIPTRCWSEWGSGCYKPYSSKEGHIEHNSITTDVYVLINGGLEAYRDKQLSKIESEYDPKDYTACQIGCSYCCDEFYGHPKPHPGQQKIL